MNALMMNMWAVNLTVCSERTWHYIAEDGIRLGTIPPELLDFGCEVLHYDHVGLPTSS